MKKHLIFVATFLLSSLLILVIFNGMRVEAQSGGNVEIPFMDDFSVDKGWVNETYGDFKIKNGYLNWNADRGLVQRFYLPINSFSGGFQLSFDFQLTSRQNNIWLIVGLAESLTGSYTLKSSPVGTFIRFGWIGGGTHYNVYYVIPLGYYPDRPAYEGGFNFKDPSTYIPFTEDKWYHAVLEVNGISWKLTVSTPEGQEVGRKSGSLPSPFGAYNYIYIGNEDYRDWPEGYGYLDNLEITKISMSITVEVDIKPGSTPNAINVRSKGVIPVAILTTSTARGESVDFDAAAVDPKSVTFGPGLATMAHKKAHIEDVDNDEDLDMVLHFRMQETGLQPGDSEVCLFGKTVDGKDIEACESIVTVGKRKK
jgi:hypothetical protein